MKLSAWFVAAGCLLAWGAPLAQAASLEAEWKDCVQEQDRDLQASGCTKLLARGKALNVADRAIAYGNRGIAFAGKDDFDRAIADYDQAIKLDPNFADAYYNRGIAHDAKDERDRAIADYDAAIRINPKYTDAYVNRGADYEAKGDHDRAIADYDSAIRLNPKDADTYHNRGIAYAAKDNHDRAIGDYDAAIRINPELAAAFYDRAISYEAKDERARAMADYDSAIRFDPEYADAYNNRGSLHQANGDYDRAIADYDQAIRVEPKSASAYSNRGSANSGKGDYAKALADFDAAIGLEPDNSRYHLLRGVAYFSKANHDLALADFDAAIGLDSADAYPALFEEIALARAGRPGKLRANSAGLDMDKWPGPVVKAWLDEITPQAAMAAATATDGKARRDNVCDANFYLGEREIARGNTAAGLQYLRRAAADCASTVIEYDVAKAELAAFAAAAKAAAVQPAPAVATPVAVAAAPAAVIAAALPPGPVSCASLGKRVALVIGNSAYPQAAALTNPVNDAADVAAILREKLCFTVIEGKDTTLAVFSEKIGAFAEAASGADVALFYYAGHGMQFQQTNYLVPVDAKIANEYDAVHGNISAQDVIALLESRAKVTLMFLDACRNNPVEEDFRRRLSVAGRGYGETRGLAPMASSRNAETLVMFATRPNDRASDGDGRNSPFTQAFLENITTPGKDIELVMRDVAASVRVKTNGKQTPQRLTELEHGLTLLPVK